MLQTIPARIAEPDRTWLALAAYNVGFGHLEDARILAQTQGKNPDSWADVSQVLPLARAGALVRQARRGYARGWEPVRFVEQVRGYLAVLEWYGDGRPAGLSPAPVLMAPPVIVPAPDRSAPARFEKVR